MDATLTLVPFPGSQEEMERAFTADFVVGSVDLGAPDHDLLLLWEGAVDEEPICVTTARGAVVWISKVAEVRAPEGHVDAARDELARLIEALGDVEVSRVGGVWELVPREETVAFVFSLGAGAMAPDERAAIFEELVSMRM